MRCRGEFLVILSIFCFTLNSAELDTALPIAVAREAVGEGQLGTVDFACILPNLR